MNVFQPENSVVVLNVAKDGTLKSVASNIDNNIRVVVANTDDAFEAAAAGMPFNKPVEAKTVVIG